MAQNKGYYILQPGERDLASLRLGPTRLFLTSERIIEAKGGGWSGRLDVRSMGLENVDHVALSLQSSVFAMVLGVILLIGGVFAFGASSVLATVLLAMGAIFLVVWLMSRRHELLLSSAGGHTIRATATGASVSLARQFAAEVESAKQARVGAFTVQAIVRQVQPPPPVEPNPDWLAVAGAPSDGGQAPEVTVREVSAEPNQPEFVAEIEGLGRLLQQNLITPGEFEAKKRQILGLPAIKAPATSKRAAKSRKSS